MSESTPNELREAVKLLSDRFPNYIIIAQDGDGERFEKWSEEHWAEGICRRTAMELEKSWVEDDDDEVDLDDSLD